MTKTDKLGHKKKSRGARDLRDTQIMSKRMLGKSTEEIAEEMGVARQTVSAVLNSDQMKAKIKEIDQKLATGIDDAIATVLESVKMDYGAAYDLLKNFGSMKTSTDINHNFPKPTVIEFSDGSKTILGTSIDDKDSDR